MNKKGFITSYVDLMKGFFVGFIIGIVLTFLVAKGLIPLAVNIC